MSPLFIHVAVREGVTVDQIVDAVDKTLGRAHHMSLEIQISEPSGLFGARIACVKLEYVYYTFGVINDVYEAVRELRGPK